MNIEDVQPAHCYARAQRVLADVALIRDEMGRTNDPRPAPEVTNAQPRECYAEASATWCKATRLAREIGATMPTTAPAGPPLLDIRPGHVLQLVDGVEHVVGEIKQRLGIAETSAEPAIESQRQPSDVLATLVRINREMSRTLERPFTPTDVYGVVALASAYAARLGGAPRTAAFERRKRPADCYARLESCLATTVVLAEKRNQRGLALRGALADVTPGDVYDLASLVLGEVKFIHALSHDVAPVYPFEPAPAGHYLPSHVYQLARTLEAQLSTIR
jgi:hypothetical protein